MKVKFANKVYEVLYTKEVAGKTMYAVEDEPNHIDWLVNVEVINEEESEDEETRKEIIGFLRRKFESSCSPTPSKNTLVNWIAWLEKQDEQKPIWSKFDELMLNDALEFIESGWSGNGKSHLVYWLKSIKDKFIEKHKKQNKQNSIDKAEQKDNEPKFKIGDWVVTDKGDTVQIKTINNGYYTISNEMYFDISYVDKYWHKWNIAGAKEGDVLSYVTDEGDLWIMIYQSLYKPYEGHVHYHALLVNDDFSGKGTCCIYIDDLKPAPKEERDLLFAKMKEANFEWNVDKKELKKIEAEPENYKQQLMSETLNLVKDYIQQKSAWTEDDEKKRTLLIKILEANHPHGLFKVNSSETMRTEELVSWLKSFNS